MDLCFAPASVAAPPESVYRGVDSTTAGETISAPEWGEQGPLSEAVRRALAARLASLIGSPVELVITNNRCSLLSARTADGTLQLRLHHMFLDAPDDTVKSLARYLARHDRRAGAVVDEFIRDNYDKISGAPTASHRLKTQGAVHDLGSIYQELNATWFGSAIDVQVSWGRRTRPRKRRQRSSLRLGVYVFRDRLIRLHPVLDQDWVPDFFVRYILFHEMLHVITPPETRSGRRHYHGPQFRARERAYPDYHRALRWERINLDRLLSS